MWAEVYGESRGPKGGEEASGGPARVEAELMGVQGSWEVTAKPLPRARRCRGSRAGPCLQDGAFLAN